MVSKNHDIISGDKMYLYLNEGEKTFYLSADMIENSNIKIVTFDSTGELVNTTHKKLMKGRNLLKLSANNLKGNQQLLVAVYVENKLSYMQKVISSSY
jgi:hypothetical protein